MENLNDELRRQKKALVRLIWRLYFLPIHIRLLRYRYMLPVPKNNNEESNGDNKTNYYCYEIFNQFKDSLPQHVLPLIDEDEEKANKMGNNNSLFLFLFVAVLFGWTLDVKNNNNYNYIFKHE
eukprot:TRINITY_DN706_c0_g1_i1.p1 TRINITY_DN706_c0_g1~~TRINITY_DN706_c0_g1_i1.p1  ORF type:complete len:123 (+),score=25.08 TRINITY_DN706_c0_g1_i1:484-852(+)